MKDNHPEAVTIEVGEKEYTLKLGPAAFRIAEIKHNLTLRLSRWQAQALQTSHVSHTWAAW